MAGQIMNTTLLEEINANLMENAKEEVEFLIKEINAIKTQLVAEIKGEDIDISSDSDNDEDELEILQTFALAFVKDEK